MRRAFASLLAVLALAFVAVPAGAQEAPVADPFAYEAPKDWKPERIPFPLGFAPSLPYRGFEQLYFAPGMFDAKSDNYFTYTFFWWVEGSPGITDETLTRGLTEYYKGLCAAVGESKQVKIDVAKVSAKVESATTPGQFAGRINAFDPWNAGRALELNVEVTVIRCEKEDRTCVFFCVSTKPKDAAQWAPMRTSLATFRCPKQ